MKLDPVKLNAHGNSDEWYCEHCTIKGDSHEDDCQDHGKSLHTRTEVASLNSSISPAFCNKCHCHYSNGCNEHSLSEQKKMAKTT